MKPLISISLLVATLLTSSVAGERELRLIECEKDTEILKLSSIDGQRILSQGKNERFLLRVPRGVKKVLIDERPKKSRFAEDMTTLSEMAVAIFNAPDKPEFFKKGLNKNCVEYVQHYTRSEVKIKTFRDKGAEPLSYDFIASPADHLYLSVNMPVGHVKELRYNQEEQIFEEREKPSSLYLGFNYKLGDVHTRYPLRELYKNLALKGLVKFSERPNQSMGVGLGYHVNDMLEVFVAQVWTEDDENVPGTKLGYTPAITYGISFNLSKGLEWIQGSI